MAWCPKCRSEFIDGIADCRKCDVALVDQLEELIEEYSYEPGKYLVTVNNEMEAGMVEGLLNAKDIHVIKKHKEAGAYLSVYMGASNFGMDIFVPEEQWTEAKEIIEMNSMLTEAHAQDLENESTGHEEITNSVEENKLNSSAGNDWGDSEAWKAEKEKVRKRRRNIVLIILLIFALPGIISYLSRWF